jgi:internalin A
MLKNKSNLSLIPVFFYVVVILLLGACNSDSNTSEDATAYVSFSIPKNTASVGNVKAQQLQNVTSIIITVTDDRGNSVSGDIWKNGGELTLSVKPHVSLTITGVAYEGSVATYSGDATAGPLAPGQVHPVSFSLTPIIQPLKPNPVVSPNNGALNIPVDTTFTTDLNPLGEEIASLSSASLTLTDNNTQQITTDFSLPESGFVLDFSLPAETMLNPGTVYTASLQVAYIDVGGNTQSYDYSWSFTTVGVLPDPVVTPTSDAVGIAIDTGFTTDLSPLSETIASVNSASLTLTSNGLSAVSTNYQAPSTGFVLNFSQATGSFLQPGSMYTANLQVEYTDNNENAQTFTYAWSFTTSSLINLNVFTDPDLAACVEQTSVESGEQNFTDFVELWCSDYGIHTLDGLEYLVNLESLNLSENFISDISPLQYLSKLRILYIDDCGECGGDNTVTDISPLSGLANLEEVDFWNNNVTDIAALSGKNNLTTVQFSGNDITAVNLSELPNLASLEARGNRIKTVNLRDDMPSLATLDLRYNYINSVSMTGGFPQLTRLDLSNQYITDIGFISGLTSLSVLFLNGNNIRDLTPLQNNTNFPSILTELNLSNNNIEDVRPLSNLTQLTILDLDDNNIFQNVDTGGVDTLEGLIQATISLRGNLRMSCDLVRVLETALVGTSGSVIWDRCFTPQSLVSDLQFTDPTLDACVKNTGVTNIDALKTLNCSYDGNPGNPEIADLTGIDALPFLEDLNLSNNTISNFAGLPNLRNLSVLNLNSANVGSVSMLSSLKNLNTLKLDSDPFNYIWSSLGVLTNIADLSLAQNSILFGISDLENLINAQTIDLSCSPAELNTEIIALDVAIDGEESPGAGVVIWGCQ